MRKREVSFADFIKTQPRVKTLRERILEETPINAVITTSMVDKFFKTCHAKTTLDSLTNEGHFEIISTFRSSSGKPSHEYKRIK